MMTDPQDQPAATPAGSRLPSLGSRGEGWVAIQILLIGLAVAAGLRGPRWPRVTRSLRLLAAVPLALGGVALFAGGSQRLGRQLTPFPRPTAEGTLKQEGAYRLVRHPIYGGVLLVGAAWALLSSPRTLLPLALAAPFLEAKRSREEAWLAERHPDYAAYRERVPRRFIPFVW
jgi:protein-S-isoprenylcysteine O-methyltransferase Ste14